LKQLADTPWRERRRRATAALRVLPDFVIAGTQKGGTSSLYSWLVGHPQVARGAVKEVHYFDHAYGRGLGWYRAHFPLGRGWPRRWLTGESSPLYMFDPRVPARIARDLPDARLIFILREPAARAWSHYRHNVERGFETLGFGAALAAEPARLAGELDKMFAEPLYRSPTYGLYCYFEKGLYLAQLERYAALIPRERMLVLSSELMFRDPDAVWDRTLRFLGLEPAPLTDRRVRNAARSAERDPAIESELAALRRRFAPHDAALRAWLGSDPGG